MLQMLIRLSRGQKRAILLLTDSLLVFPALAVAYLLQMQTGTRPGPVELAMIGTGLIPLACGLSLVLGVAATRISAYETWAMGQSALFSAALGFGLWGFLGALGLSPAGPTAIVFAAGFFFLTVSARLAMYHVLACAHAAGRAQIRVAIYGAGAAGMQLARALAGHAGIRAVCFVDDNPALHGMRVAGLAVHPPLQLPVLARRHDLQRIILAMPSADPDQRARLTTALEDKGLRVVAMQGFSALVSDTAPRTAVSGALPALARPRQPHSRAARDTYAGRRVLITGAGGSIGSELARQVLAMRPARLVLLDHSEFALYRIEGQLRDPARRSGVPLDCQLGSIGDAPMLARLMPPGAIDIVLHAAAYKHVPLVEANPTAGLQNNVLGTDTLLKAAIAGRVERFLLVSSDKAVRPAGTMGVTKWIAEQLVQDAGTRLPGIATGIVRFGNVIGSSGSVLPLFREQVRCGGPVTVTDPEVSRYFMSVDEAVHLVLEAGAMARDGEVFLFDMGAPVRIVDLARQMIAAAGYTPRDDASPGGEIEIRYTGLRPGEKLAEDLIWSDRRQRTDHPRIFTAPEPRLSEIEIAGLLRRVRRAVAEGQGLDPADLPVAGIADGVSRQRTRA